MTVKNNNGFTLIEILVVIFIIGLLSSVVLVGLGSFRARGRDARRIADLRLTLNVLELYYAKNGQYPDANNWGDLTSLLKNAGIGVSALSNDPSDSQSYNYGVSANKQSYATGALLEDPDHPVLRDDVDGEGSANFGVSCNDPNYCLKL